MMSNDQNLEPEGESLLRSGSKNANELSLVPALYSISISLKRIADKLELASKQPIIMTAEEALEYYKKKDGC